MTTTGVEGRDLERAQARKTLETRNPSVGALHHRLPQTEEEKAAKKKARRQDPDPHQGPGRARGSLAPVPG